MFVYNTTAETVPICGDGDGDGDVEAGMYYIIHRRLSTGIILIMSVTVPYLMVCGCCGLQP